MAKVVSTSYAEMVRGITSHSWDGANRRNYVNLWRQSIPSATSADLAIVAQQLYEGSNRKGVIPHPTKATKGEAFSDGFKRSYVEFLLRKSKTRSGRCK
jgi:hypothetical protein